MFVGCLCLTNNSSSCCNLENFLYLTWLLPIFSSPSYNRKTLNPTLINILVNSPIFIFQNLVRPFPTCYFMPFFYPGHLILTQQFVVSTSNNCFHFLMAYALQRGGLLLQSLRASTGLQPSTYSPSRQLTSLQRHPTTQTPHTRMINRCQPSIRICMREYHVR